jgi:NADPH:quinone reductase-like Zn-dependent oxidoreductase
MRIAELPKPVPGPGEVLVKVVRTALNAADWRLLTADPFLIRLMMGFFTPKYNILGADIAGIVEAVGSKVGRFKPGDRVFGDMSNHRWGGLGEYLCAPERILALKPDSLSFTEAAALPMAGITALQGLRDFGMLKSGEMVAVNGASGGVGTFAVQIAKVLGAHVTAVCSRGKMEMVSGLGADEVVDYATEDFTLRESSFDLIYAANGYHPIRDYRRALKPGGRYVMAGGLPKQMFEVFFMGKIVFSGSGKTGAAVIIKPSVEDLNLLASWHGSGAIKPVIDRTYPFDQIPDAMRYLRDGHAVGKVIIEMGAEA